MHVRFHADGIDAGVRPAATRHIFQRIEHIGGFVIERFGAEAVYTEGLRVYTTLDQRVQQIAEETIATRLSRGARTDRDPLEGALVAIEPSTGYVKALVGGRDFRETPFNRAIDARRFSSTMPWPSTRLPRS